MSEFIPLPVDRLRRVCRMDRLAFETTAELEELAEFLGQSRAVEAVQFGVDVRGEGFNVYVMGPPGHGKRALVRSHLRPRAEAEPTPPDWVYVNNFSNSQQPVALRLSSGDGRRLKLDMQQLIAELQTVIPAAYESEEYRTRGEEILEEFKEKERGAIKRIQKEAGRRDIALIRTPDGFTFAPTPEGKVLEKKEFNKLPVTRKAEIEQALMALQEELVETLGHIAEWRKQRRKKVQKLNRDITNFAVGQLINELKKEYAELGDVGAYLEAVQQDVVEHVDDFRAKEGNITLIRTPEGFTFEPTREGQVLEEEFDKSGDVVGELKDAVQEGVDHVGDFGDEEEEDPIAAMLESAGRLPASFQRYEVNLLVDREKAKGAPVVELDNPTYQNLIGRVEHVAHLGTLVTNFTFIRAGALHEANGGYLLIDIRKLLTQPFAWEGLKRCLRTNEIKIESPGEMLSLTSTVSLNPQPIPLDIKIVLMGDRLLYYLLLQLDPDFVELFKVAADFEDRLDRTEEQELLYARVIATIVRRQELRPFDRGAVALVIEQAARLADDASKLSSHFRAVADLLSEADHRAGKSDCETVTAEHVQQAIDAQLRRADRVRLLIQEQIERGVIRIDTEGERKAQVNALSVIDLGDVSFARPSRITATARIGSGDVIDIEREVELGGPIHSKGVLILSHFLAARYCPDDPLSLSASLVFEQCYGGVEGDSASMAELCALLSALAGVPIKQTLAVTGSVDQHGGCQAVGGVNEKIEGFFDACQARGLSGEQGVLIPQANVEHLMLRHDVVEAAGADRFRVYGVQDIDDTMALLTGLPAGQRDAEGRFPDGSVNALVEARLRELSAIRQKFNQTAEPEGNGAGGDA